jgi:hypothetical protein
MPRVELQPSSTEGVDPRGLLGLPELTELPAREAITELSRGWIQGEWPRPELDLDQTLVEGIAGLAESSYDQEVRLFSGAVRELGAGKVSRLVRAIRDWNTEVEERVFVGSTQVFAYEYLYTQILTANHDLLTFGPKRTARRWFIRWRDVALRALDEKFSGLQMLELLRVAEAWLRRHWRPSPPPRRLASPERLKRLADTIVAHAPPRRLAAEAMPCEAG